MSNTASNIAKGIWGRLTGKHRKDDGLGISWMQEKILKHQDDNSIKKIVLDNTTVYYKRPYELLHTWREIFGRQIYRFNTATDDPLIIDCGANIGISSMYFKKQFPASKLIAFEPDGNNFELLKKNLAGDLQTCDLRQEAVWIENGTISFDASESEASRISEKNATGKPVKCIRLADLLSEFKSVDFIKIDIEGAEYEVIKDCASVLSRVQNMFLEYHGKTNETFKLNELLQIVRNNGFSVYVQNAADTLEHPFVNKTTATPYDVQLNLYCYKNN
jgi:FkbM family methyltransferase